MSKIAKCRLVSESVTATSSPEYPRCLHGKEACETYPGHLPSLANRRSETRPPNVTTFGMAWKMLSRQLSATIAYPKSISGTLQALYSWRKRFRTFSVKMTRGRRSFPVHSWADFHQACKNISREAEKHRYPRSNFYLLLMMHDHLVDFE